MWDESQNRYADSVEYCGGQSVPDVIQSCFGLHLYFYSDVSEAERGFEIAYTKGSC